MATAQITTLKPFQVPDDLISADQYENNRELLITLRETADFIHRGDLANALDHLRNCELLALTLPQAAVNVTAGTEETPAASTAFGKSSPPDASPVRVPRSLRARIAKLRNRMFSPMAAVNVASQAVDHEDESSSNMHQLLSDAYRQLDGIALELWEIGGDVEAESTESASPEVVHG